MLIDSDDLAEMLVEEASVRGVRLKVISKVLGAVHERQCSHRLLECPPKEGRHLLGENAVILHVGAPHVIVDTTGSKPKGGSVKFDLRDPKSIDEIFKVLNVRSQRAS